MMLIMSQDKELIMNLDNADDIDLDPNTDYTTIDIDNCEMGEYKSEERCKEILIEIMKTADVGGRVYYMPEE